jgi:hypothetical protein
VTGTLLVAGEHMTNEAVSERVVGREDGSARNAEHHLDTEAFKRPDDHFGSAD